MEGTTTTKPVRDLQVGDVVLGIGATVFTEPHTVTKVSGATVGGQFKVSAIYATGGSFWPAPLVGHHVATVAA